MVTRFKWWIYSINFITFAGIHPPDNFWMDRPKGMGDQQ